MFGGYDENFNRLGQTWAYDFNTNTWSEQATEPPPRASARMVYDTESDRIILFGGFAITECASVGNFDFFDDTWAYDYNTDTWTNMESSNSPSARFNQTMAYDSQADRVILYGSITKLPLESDERHLAWSYDYNTNTWNALGPIEMELDVARYANMDYDKESSRMVHYGMGETRIYNYTADSWQTVELGSGSDTLPRLEWGGTVMVYNEALDRMVVFGGCEENFRCTNDVWLYDLNSNTWEKMEMNP